MTTFDARLDPADVLARLLVAQVRIDWLTALLREYEWVGGEPAHCMVCRGEQPEHVTGCKLAEALA